MELIKNQWLTGMLIIEKRPSPDLCGMEWLMAAGAQGMALGLDLRDCQLARWGVKSKTRFDVSKFESPEAAIEYLLNTMEKEEMAGIDAVFQRIGFTADDEAYVDSYIRVRRLVGVIRGLCWHPK